MTLLATFTIEGEVVGTATLEPTPDPRGRQRYPDSAVFVCPQCGRAWAQIAVEGQQFYPWSRSCQRHAALYSTDIPGSIWQDWDPGYLGALPPGVLGREFELHLRHAEQLASAA